MAGEVQDSFWPIPKFYFRLRFGLQDIAFFQELSGLDVEDQPMEYRHGNNPVFSSVNILRNEKRGNVTLKKGVFINGKNFQEWYEKISMNSIPRETAIIDLLEESGNPIMTWTLKNAWPVKISSTDLNSDANEIAVETMELSHEGLTIKNG